MVSQGQELQCGEGRAEVDQHAEMAGQLQVSLSPVAAAVCAGQWHVTSTAGFNKGSALPVPCDGNEGAGFSMLSIAWKGFSATLNWLGASTGHLLGF